MLSQTTLDVFHRCSMSCVYKNAYPDCPFRSFEGLSYESRNKVFKEMEVEQAVALMAIAQQKGCPSIGKLHPDENCHRNAL